MAVLTKEMVNIKTEVSAPTKN